ncbi:hypothetical protein V3H18_07805 [Methylocystis sp. 9N]|uniref:Uncharacterized protein n=1 Tax=Methylocystis borbori TaxID=3118750 RepID=A0ABU7XGD3_9HYPH
MSRLDVTEKILAAKIRQGLKGLMSPRRPQTGDAEKQKLPSGRARREP